MDAYTVIFEEERIRIFCLHAKVDKQFSTANKMDKYNLICLFINVI